MKKLSNVKTDVQILYIPLYIICTYPGTANGHKQLKRKNKKIVRINKCTKRTKRE